MANGDVFRKGVLAQGGELSGPDTSGASFSRQGVVSQEGLFKGQAQAAGLAGTAQAIDEFGGIALDLDKRFALADLERQVQSEAIEPFLESRTPGFAERQQAAFEDAAVDNFELEQRANALRETMGEGAAIEKLDPEFAAMTKRLENAKRQGVMSEQDLQIRIKALTRAAINKRPGLMNELTAHAQNVLGLSGAQEHAKMVDQIGQAEAKADQQIRNRTMAFLDKTYVEFDPNESTESLVEKSNKIKRQRNSFESIKNDAEIQQMLANQSEDQIASSPITRDVVIGGFDVHSTNIMDLFSPDMSGADLNKAVLQANTMALQFQADIDTNPTFAKVAHRPEMKKLRDDWVSNMENTISELKNFKTGEAALQFLNNRLATVRANDELGVHKQVSPAKINMLSKLGAFAGPLAMQDADRRGRFLTLVDGIMEGGLNNPALEEGYARTRESGKSNFASILGPDGLLEASVPSTEDSPEQARTKDPQQYAEAVGTSFRYLQKELDPNKRMPVIRDLVKEMGRPEMRNYYDNLPIEVQSQYLDLLEEQSNIVVNTIDDVFAQAEKKGINLRTRIIEGRMRFESDDNSPQTRQFLQRENMRVATAHQEVVKAFAVRFGKSFFETSKMLQKVYTKQDRQQLMQVLDELEEDVNLRQDPAAVQTNEVVSDDFLDRVSQIESGGNPNAKASTSSALGEFQFIESTWLDIMNKNFPNVVEGKSRQEILALRTDSGLSRKAATALANENAQVLEQNGVEVNDANLYLAHFLGSRAAANLLRSPDGTDVEDILPASAVKANRSVLEGKKVRDVVAWAQTKMNQQNREG